MPLNRFTTRDFHLRLYSTELESVQLLKRSFDQNEGTITVYNLNQIRRSHISSTGEPINLDEQVGTRTIFHIPRTELDRVGCLSILPGDRLIDFAGRYWAPFAENVIDRRLFENFLDLQCQRVDPPMPPTPPVNPLL